MTYSNSTWRNAAAPIIARTIKQVGTDDMPALRRALREAYPWGERRLHPYKIWCDEIRRQLAVGSGARHCRRPEPVAPGQIDLFSTAMAATRGAAAPPPATPHAPPAP